jgi:hypothetical protein
MRYVRAALRFCYDFVVGDDWRIAAGVVTVLAVGAVLVAFGVPHGVVACWGVVGLLAVVLTSLLTAVRRR